MALLTITSAAVGATAAGAAYRASAAAEDPAAAPESGGTDAGARAFQKCYACHSVEPGETGLPGPNLHGVVGRPAGALDGFAYSEAMAGAGRDGGLVWTEERLDAFLADPEGYLPGTDMSFVGMRDPAERAAVIGYLKGFPD